MGILFIPISKREAEEFSREEWSILLSILIHSMDSIKRDIKWTFYLCRNPEVREVIYRK